MVSLRLALEAQINAEDPTELEDEPIVNRAGFEFIEGGPPDCVNDLFAATAVKGAFSAFSRRQRLTPVVAVAT